MIQQALQLISEHAPAFLRALEDRIKKNSATPELLAGIASILSPFEAHPELDFERSHWLELRALLLDGSGANPGADLRLLPRPPLASHILRHIKTGDMYVVADGGLGRKVALSDTRHYDLEPAHTFLDPIDGSHTQGPRRGQEFKALNKTHALTLVVTEQELKELFEPESRWYAQRNSPIETLMAQYEREECDFSDIRWCARSGARIAQTMPDSQGRCFMQALSTFALESMGLELTPLLDFEDPGGQQESRALAPRAPKPLD